MFLYISTFVRQSKSAFVTKTKMLNSGKIKYRHIYLFIPIPDDIHF